jgi:CDP-glucose 4,6-dehydratase
LHPYEVCKATLDLAAQSYGKIYNLPIGVTRCGNYFGPYDFNYTRLVPGVIRSVLRGERPQLRSNGRFSRDYLHVQDGAEAHILLAERLSDDPSLYGEAFNFSIGQAVEVIDVVRRIIAISGANVEPIITDSARAEIPRMELSSEKARRLLGWAPGAPFDERLRQTVEWYRSHQVVAV